MILIAGLGNPGDRFEGTRHNTGFAVIDELSEREEIPVKKREHKAFTGRGSVGKEEVLLVKPQTYMNESGKSIGELASYYDLTPDHIVVVVDDIHLPVGQIRIRRKGSAGGHNGMKSVIAALGTEEFPRIRVGVGEKPEGEDLVAYVLGRFEGEDAKKIEDGIFLASDAVPVLVNEGIAEAMNRFNGKKND